jgi:hypothetical protein
MISVLSALLDCDDTPAFEVASNLNISGSTLSRLAHGIVKKRLLLDKVAKYYAEKFKTAISGSDLTVRIPAKSIVAIGRWISDNGGKA